MRHYWLHFFPTRSLSLVSCLQKAAQVRITPMMSKQTDGFTDFTRRFSWPELLHACNSRTKTNNRDCTLPRARKLHGCGPSSAQPRPGAAGGAKPETGTLGTPAPSSAWATAVLRELPEIKVILTEARIPIQAQADILVPQSCSYTPLTGSPGLQLPSKPS